MDWITFLPPLAYLISLLLVAYVLRDQNRSDSDYFLAGRKIRSVPAILSVVANETSVATVMIFPAAGFKSDYVLLWLVLGYILGRSLVAVFFMRKLYEHHNLSVYETIGGSRSGSVPLALAYVAAKYIANGARFYMAGYALEQLFGWSVIGWILLVAAIVSIYSLTGGIRAVVITDQIQGTVIYAMGLALCAFLGYELLSIGRTGAAHADLGSILGNLRLTDGRFSLSNPDYWLTLLAGGMVLSIGTHGADQDMIQRILAVQSARRAQRSIFISGLGAAVVIATYLTIGILLRETGHLDLDPKSPLVDFVLRLGQPLLTGFFAVLLLSTGMSSLDSAVNSTGAIWKFVLKSERPGLHWSVFSLGCLVTSSVLFSLLGRSDFLALALGSMSYIHGALIGILIVYTLRPHWIVPAGIVLAVAASAGTTVALQKLTSFVWTVQLLCSTSAALLLCAAAGFLQGPRRAA